MGRAGTARKATGGLNLDLLSQLTFYGAYHNNPWNQLIHFIFVPGIIFSLFIWLAYLPLPFPFADLSRVQDLLPAFISNFWRAGLVPNVALAVTLAYCAFYLVLDFVAGLTWSLFVGIPLWWAASALALGVPYAWAYSIPLHIFSWFMQIYPGHTLLEKRKPALLDSAIQAFALAPLFVWFEALFLFGYRRALYEQLQKRVAEEIAKLKQHSS